LRQNQQGDRYLLRLLVLGATTLLRHACGKTSVTAGWINALLARRPAGIVKIAAANKLARIAWAVLRGNQGYRAPPDQLVKTPKAPYHAGAVHTGLSEIRGDLLTPVMFLLHHLFGTRE
jgi:hypothetical protein